MTRFRASTLRRMPPETRAFARLANELASVQTRLVNRLDKLAILESDAALDADGGCARADHQAIIAAAIAYGITVRDDAAPFPERRDALERLIDALGPLLTPLFDGEAMTEPEAAENGGEGS